MKFKKINDSMYVIKLEPEEEIIEEVVSFCKDLDIASAEIKGLGALGSAELKLYSVGKKEYSTRKFNEEMEICSLVGIVTNAGLHAHIVLSNNKMQAFGGHLESGIVSATCEIILTIIPEELSRVYDERTGLNVLDI